MTHVPVLIQDLGVILIIAAVTTLIFKWLKQPVVLGYLIAGLLVGPHVSFVPTVGDRESIQVWAEIGVIFLLFGLGLEFSFKKLAKVGRSASIAALFEIITMTTVGYLLGQALGWTSMDSIFLGAILSMSSTTIIIRAFNELGLKAKGFVSLVFGVLIVEDLAAILILVLLSTLATPGATSGVHLIYSTFRLGFFLLLWFLVGIYFVPLFLKSIKRFLSDETLLVVSIGLCLAMVMLATQVGFSPALGAFVMGSILAETREGKRIDRLMLPVRDLFGAVFFVSVGMMIDPKILGEHYAVIALIIVVTIFGKLFGSGLGALLSGRSLQQSVQGGLSLAQIGEFSFLIATLGETLKVTSPFLYPIVIAVSAVTTFTTPYMIKYSGSIYKFMEHRIPVRVLDRLRQYESTVDVASDVKGFALFWKKHGVLILMNSVVALGLSLVVSQFLRPKAEEFFGHHVWLRIAACALALLLSAPFLRAIFAGSLFLKRGRVSDAPVAASRPHVGIRTMRIVCGIILIGAIIGQFTNLKTFSGIILFAVAAAAVSTSGILDAFYGVIEKRFLANLNSNKEAEDGAPRPQLAPWDALLAEFVMSPDSELVGKRLDESAFKENTGASIAMIERGSKRILAPNRGTVLMPFDRVSVRGSDDQLALAGAKVEGQDVSLAVEAEESVGLESLVLNEVSPFINKTIRECGLREAVHGIIVGVERGGERILNPDSSLELQAWDRLWIVGAVGRLEDIR